MELEAITVDALLARLEAERRGGEGIASDCDGTLWAGDVGEALFETALERRALEEPALEPLAAEARRQGMEAGGGPSDIAERLYAAQKAGRYADADAYAMQAWCYAGFALGDFERLCDEVLERHGLPEAVAGLTTRLVVFARERGLAFWLVSASPAPLVRRAAVRLGLEPARVVGMEPAMRDGVIEARLVAEPTHGDGKVRRLRARTRAPLLLGMGDSSYDAALIAEARIGVAVCPSEALRQALSGTGAVVLG